MSQGNGSDIDWVIRECKYVEHRLAERLGRRDEFKVMIDQANVPSSIRTDMHRMRMARNPVTHIEGVDCLDDRADFTARAARVRAYFSGEAAPLSVGSSGSRWMLWIVGLVVVATFAPPVGDAVASLALRAFNALIGAASRVLEATVFVWVPLLLWHLLRKR